MTTRRPSSGPVPRYVDFNRGEWAGLRAATPLTLTESDLERLSGITEAVSLDEVRDVYLPLSRLLDLYVAATQDLHRVADTFLGKPAGRVPYVLGIAGSVAVGKSTTARILQALLARWPHSPRVDLVTTDGFLLPNAELERRGLAARKGFPESYDVRALIAVLTRVKAGDPKVAVPTYSHERYDVQDDVQWLREPDVVIVEGLNVLQTGDGRGPSPMRTFVSDFFDFSLYVDATEADVARWYVERFLTLRRTVFREPGSYFRRYADLSDEEAVSTAKGIWSEINGPNLRQNIRPTRERAHLVLEKGTDHAVRRVRLRKI